MTLQIQKAFDFYRQYILLPVREKEAMRRLYGFDGGALVSPNDWELFAAILIAAPKSNNRYGHDLAEAEVKSAKEGGGFEYQYHLNTGLQKLEGDMRIDHLFISYSADYEDVVVRVMSAQSLQAHFEVWRPALLANYASRGTDEVGGRQRFRKSIPFGFVKINGRLIVQIQRGEMVYSTDEPIAVIFPNRLRI